jgi:orotidine-5'-phosphate decarboxylase
MKAAERLIVALDDPASALALARRLRGAARILKIGSIAFTACGPALIRRVRALGFEVMLDLKFHDIPSTVEGSCRAAVAHQPRFLTVHAAGGRTMLEAAVAAVRAEARRRRLPAPGVLAVTVLTSVSAKPAGRLASRVVALARDAARAGCEGVVASAREAAAIRRACGPRLRLVCPGIRPPGADAGDQSRVCGPREALERGADFLVVGRPIAAAPDPRRAAQAMLKAMEAARR